MREQLFKDIYVLLRKKHFSEVLDLLGLFKGSKLASVFWADANHAWYLAGDAYSRMELYDKSLLAFKKSLRTRPDDMEALWAVADCYSNLNRPKMAERYYRRALEISAKEELFYNLGNALFDQGKFIESINEYKKVSKDNSSYTVAQKNIEVAQRLNLNETTINYDGKGDATL